MSLTKSMDFAHASGQLNVIFPQFSEHLVRRDIDAVIVQNVLELLNMADGSQCRTADLPSPFANSAEGRENLLALFAENPMIISKVWPASVPIEVPSLKVEREHVGK